MRNEEREMNTAKFKDSPLGPIPQDWEVKRLGDLFDFAAAGDLQDNCSSKMPTHDNIYPIYSNTVPQKGLYGYTSRPRFKKGCMTITGRGTLGHAEYRDSDFDAIIRLIVMQPHKDVDARFFVAYVNTYSPFTVSVSSIPQLTVPQVQETIVPYPPLPEQQRIAEALGEVDKLIESLDEQIEKKRLIAKGVAHDLLSGKKRLPGFKGEWEMVKLGDMGIWLKGQALSKSDVTSTGTYECIHYGELFTKYGPVIQTIVSRTDKEPTISSVCGDILFPSSDVTPEGLGRCSAIMADGVVLGGDMIILRLGVTCSPQLVSHVINQNRRMIIAKVTGITVRHITSKALSNIEIPLPPTLAEQQAIANLLSEQDADIAALEAKREKYARIKEGMMRDLLTGKVRLKGE